MVIWFWFFFLYILYIVILFISLKGAKTDFKNRNLNLEILTCSHDTATNSKKMNCDFSQILNLRLDLALYSTKNWVDWMKTKNK